MSRDIDRLRAGVEAIAAQVRARQARRRRRWGWPLATLLALAAAAHGQWHAWQADADRAAAADFA